MEKMNLSINKFKSTRMSTKFSSQKDFSYPFPWPHRTYKCSFCKKEFQSAQALGGHMNVHRRDRAKMRLMPSWDNSTHNQNPKPNPNPNPNLSTASSPQSALLDQFCSPFSGSTDEEKLPIVANHLIHQVNLNEGVSLHLGELKGFGKRRSDFRVLEKKDAKEDLDLELRLGYC